MKISAKNRENGEDSDISRDLPLGKLIALFNMSTRTVQRMIDGGYIVKKSNGLYQENTAVQGAIRYAKDNGNIKGVTKDASTTRVNEARARSIEQETALKARELLSFSEHCAIIDILLGGISAELESLPSQLTRDMTLRKQYEARLVDMKRRLQDKWERLAKSAEDDAETDSEETEE